MARTTAPTSAEHRARRRARGADVGEVAGRVLAVLRVGAVPRRTGAP
jgi:hypothetical protein